MNQRLVNREPAASTIARSGQRRGGFTLIEMLTTVAVLIVVLGLMVSLARFVRDRSAQQLTRDLLNKLDLLMDQYVQTTGGRLPAVEPLLEPSAAVVKEADLRDVARRNNEQCIAALRAMGWEARPPEDPFATLPISVYDVDPRRPNRVSLRDAWGSPIVFMAGQHPLIGLAPSRERTDQYFFFSAGPDRKYLTRDDNLNSYETSVRSH
jgi:type II secretory pathway pseudopilin PulG